MINVSVSGKQKMIDEIKKALSKVTTDKFVTVGIHEDAGNHPDSNMTNAKLGAIQHYGNDDIPPRPWLDVGVETGNAQYLKILTQTIDNGDDIDQALNQIGVTAVAKAQIYMTQLSEPANAESTIARKGSSNPLIDTGELRQSVTYKIETGTPEEGIE